MRSFNEALDLVAHAAFKGLNEDVTFPCSPCRLTWGHGMSLHLGAWDEPISDDEKQIAYLAESVFDLSTRTIRRTLSRTD